MFQKNSLPFFDPEVETNMPNTMASWKLEGQLPGNRFTCAELFNGQRGRGLWDNFIGKDVQNDGKAVDIPICSNE